MGKISTQTNTGLITSFFDQQLKVKLLLAAIIFLAAYCWSCGSWGHARAKRDFSAGRIKELDTYLDEIKRALPVPGISIVVISNDSVYSKSSGIANARKDPLHADLPFSAGSISEPMLATAVMKLSASGKIKLDDPVAQYLPYFKLSGKVNKSVTIRHLLSHTSGIQHYNLMWDMPDNTAGALEATTRSIAEQQPKFPVAGSRVSRSPYNYDILADLISKVTGKPFEEYVDREVFKPLGMHASSFSKPAVSVMPFSITNWLSYTTRQDSLYPYNRENGGSNGLHSSAGDMASWMYMLLNKGKTTGKPFVANAGFETFFSPQYRTGEASSVGFGWDINGKEDEEIYTKISKITSFSSGVTLIPGQKAGIAVFSNIGDFDTAEITRNIILWLKGGRLPHPKVSVAMVMGKKLGETRNLDSAFKAYTLLKQSHSTAYDLSAAALNSFGISLIRHFKDKEKAIAIFKFCTVQYPRSAAGYLNLAETYMLNRDVFNARLAMERSRPFQTASDRSHADDIERYIVQITTDPDPG